MVTTPPEFPSDGYKGIASVDYMLSLQLQNQQLQRQHQPQRHEQQESQPRHRQYQEIQQHGDSDAADTEALHAPQPIRMHNIQAFQSGAQIQPHCSCPYSNQPDAEPDVESEPDAEWEPDIELGTSEKMPDRPINPSQPRKAAQAQSSLNKKGGNKPAARQAEPERNRVTKSTNSQRRPRLRTATAQRKEIRMRKRGPRRLAPAAPPNVQAPNVNPPIVQQGSSTDV
ncbi:hypothetical protein QBC46DRAFT_376054 [Diplogelasinospora grovesii]|uniref:Uncharacterized protein n=1 Tax=Diplogelasinospora grovesii TaxID=303347 RepID=A0AAN6NDX7_9PEZI|nr:hypothetical protein QBC46DRAFT_376054 [Diplogelasinospora grovesii]